jgi:hypothetical protein
MESPATMMEVEPIIATRNTRCEDAKKGSATSAAARGRSRNRATDQTFRASALPKSPCGSSSTQAMSRA